MRFRRDRAAPEPIIHDNRAGIAFVRGVARVAVVTATVCIGAFGFVVLVIWLLFRDHIQENARHPAPPYASEPVTVYPTVDGQAPPDTSVPRVEQHPGGSHPPATHIRPEENR